MGMCAANAAFVADARQGVLKITEDLPYAGTIIPLATNRAGVTSHFDALQVTYGSLMSGIGADERRLPSALDVLANAQVSGFTLAIPGSSSAILSRAATSRSTGRVETAAPAQRK
jgi:hypothetical protein